MNKLEFAISATPTSHQGRISRERTRAASILTDDGAESLHEENDDTLSGINLLCDNVLQACSAIIQCVKEPTTWWDVISGAVILTLHDRISIIEQIVDIRSRTQDILVSAITHLEQRLHSPLRIFLGAYIEVVKLDNEIGSIVSGNSLPKEVLQRHTTHTPFYENEEESDVARLAA